MVGIETAPACSRSLDPNDPAVADVERKSGKALAPPRLHLALWSRVRWAGRTVGEQSPGPSSAPILVVAAKSVSHQRSRPVRACSAMSARAHGCRSIRARPHLDADDPRRGGVATCLLRSRNHPLSSLSPPLRSWRTHRCRRPNVQVGEDAPLAALDHGLRKPAKAVRRCRCDCGVTPEFGELLASIPTRCRPNPLCAGDPRA